MIRRKLAKKFSARLMALVNLNAASDAERRKFSAWEGMGWK